MTLRAVLGRLAEAGYDIEHKPNVKDMLIGFIAGAKVPVQTRCLQAGLARRISVCSPR